MSLSRKATAYCSSPKPRSQSVISIDIAAAFHHRLRRRQGQSRRSPSSAELETEGGHHLLIASWISRSMLPRDSSAADFVINGRLTKAELSATDLPLPSSTATILSGSRGWRVVHLPPAWPIILPLCISRESHPPPVQAAVPCLLSRRCSVWLLLSDAI